MEKEGNQEKDSADSSDILVHGILGIDKETVELFFESKKKCGGGDIKSIDVHEDRDEAVITYCDPSVVDRVLERGPQFMLDSHAMTVERPPKPDPHSILVQGIPEKVTLEILQLLFENKKRTSGGEIHKIEYEEGSGEAVICFEDVKVAKQVLSRKHITLDGALLTVTKVTPKLLKTDSTHSDEKNRVNPRVVQKLVKVLVEVHLPR